MLDAIKILQMVVDKGSFSDAARALQISPSSVTRQIDKLETMLNCKVLHRTTRYLALTDAGQRVLLHGAEIQQQLDALVGSLQQPQAVLTGKLRLAVFDSLGRFQVCQLVAEFLREQPHVNIELQLGLSRLTSSEHYDLLIRLAPSANPKLLNIKLLNNDMALVATPAYLHQHGVPNHPSQLKTHNCLAIADDFSEQIWHFSLTEQRIDVAVNGNLRSLSGTPLLAAAEQGLGIAMLPLWMLQPALASRRLCLVLPQWAVMSNPQGQDALYAVCGREVAEKPAVQALLKFLQERLQDYEQRCYPQLQALHRAYDTPGN